MGVEYTIANKKNRTMYELGKGSWFGMIEAAGSELELLQLVVGEALYQPESEYVVEIAAALAEFTKDTPLDQLVVFNDCGDETALCRALGYRYTGSRYRPEDLTFLNRHLDGSERSKRMYDLDSWKDHPDYERFADPPKE